MKTYSATEVIALLDGQITYRMLDYWLRTGVVCIDDGALGSGTRRRFTETEVRALRKLVDHYSALNAELEKIRDGVTWAILSQAEKHYDRELTATA
jgi:DNA-binding transcriptional MerR regulator